MPNLQEIKCFYCGATEYQAILTMRTRIEDYDSDSMNAKRGLMYMCIHTQDCQERANGRETNPLKITGTKERNHDQ